MSLRKYKNGIFANIPPPQKLKSQITQMRKTVLLEIAGFVLLLLLFVLFFKREVTLVYLTTVATIRHNVLPNRFTGDYAHDPYGLLEYYFDGKQFSELPLNERCDNYFSRIFPKSNWRFDTFDNEIYWLDALRDRYELLRDKEKLGCERLGKTFSETWFKYEYLEKVQNNLDFESAILRSIPHYKVFAKCYLDDNTAEEEELGDSELLLSQSVESKLFPFFSKKLIDYKNLETNEHFSRIFKANTFHSYTKNMKSSFTGRGIAISASDNHFKLLSGLIALLRIQGNELPIEIIYRNDLSIWNQEDLMEIARTNNLLEHSSLKKQFESIWSTNKDDFDRISKLMFDYRMYNNVSDIKFPKQDIRFVNAHVAIKDEYQGLFQAYSNKLVAFFFSSFKEMILMDSDTVPLINLENFFKSEKYLKSKAFFFRDREIDEHFPQESIDFFTNLLPNDKDAKYFNLQKISEENLYHNRFLNNSLNHLMESGIVVIDKNKHFNGALLTLALQSWKPISQPIHGEKELYWLGQLISGDEEFVFNNNYAISVGKLTPKSFNNTQVQTKANELCSTHPGHISDDAKTLYWMNSGFEFCKKQNKFKLDLPIDLNYYNEFDYTNLAKYETMKDYYTEPLRINAALIPPSTIYKYNNTKPYWEPSKSWVMTQKCEGYLWCAYDLIGGGDYEGDQYRGKVVEFDSYLEQIYDFYGDIWMYYYNLIF